MDTDDEVTNQLRTLREADGLTTGRLSQRSALLSAMGTSDAATARAQLEAIIAGLPDGEHARALHVDYGLQLQDHLGRAPTEDEQSRLGRRRASYAERVGRDVKTLSRWSDKAVRELRTRLIDDSFRGHLYVVAAVDDDRIAGITLIQESPEQSPDSPTRRESIELVNPVDDASLPCLLYAFPRDWSPRSLTLAAVFRKTRPRIVVALIDEQLLTAPFAVKRKEIPLDGDTATCRIEHPRRDRIYGIWW